MSAGSSDKSLLRSGIRYTVHVSAGLHTDLVLTNIKILLHGSSINPYSMCRLRLWAAREFGPEVAEATADVMNTYGMLAARRKVGTDESARSESLLISRYLREALLPSAMDES